MEEQERHLKSQTAANHLSQKHLSRPMDTVTIRQTGELPDRQVCTWYQLPVRPHGHLVTQSRPDKDTSSVVQSPEKTIVGTRLDTDQLHSYWLQKHVDPVTWTDDAHHVQVCV